MEKAFFDTSLYRGLAQLSAHGRFPGEHKTLGMAHRPIDAPIGQAKKLKTGIHVNVGHPSRVNKRQFGRVKVSHPGFRKKTHYGKTLFALPTW